MRLLTFILILISFQVFAQKTQKVKNTLPYGYEEYYIIKQKGQESYNQGTYKRYEKNKVVETGDYNNGKKDGKWEIKQKTGYQNYYYSLGILDSTYRFTGNSISIIKYDFEGNETVNIYQMGDLRITKEALGGGVYYTKTNVKKNGAENEILAQGILINDKMQGPWQFTNSNGSYCKLNFKNGNKVGKQKSFHANSQPYSTLTYNDSSKLEGPYLIQYINGDTLFYQNYINGRQDGYGTAKYKNGKPYYSALYNEGRVLSFTEHTVAGVDIQKSKIENGSGQIMEYSWVNGALKVSTATTYADGLPNGMRFHFSGDTVTYSEKYENGLFMGYGKEPSSSFIRLSNETDTLTDTFLPRINFDMLDTASSVESMFVKGEFGLQQHIARNISYPIKALENDRQGIVQIMFVVDKLGVLKDPEVISTKLGFGLDEEALRVINATNNMWSHAVYYGIPAEMRYFIPIKFQIF
jgi:antitoxin component YwqK of YwqJK toxin-antitoxin module